MRQTLAILLTIMLLLAPLSTAAQSGDASWLENQEGLQTAIGRSWTAPVVMVEESTLVEYNDEGTPVSDISWRTEPSSTPVVSDEMQTEMLSALIYEFDSEENAATAIEMFNDVQRDQISRDPRSPATNEFTPELGDVAYGNEGTYEIEHMDGSTEEAAVVYLLVQDGVLIYQIFGLFLPGNHIDLTTGVVEQMMAAEVGDADPVYQLHGGSTGGLWEKLNAIDIAMPEGSVVTDLEMYPVPDDAVMGDSVMVPVIDLDNLAAVPGVTGSWHITYAPADSGVLTATPSVMPEGVFNIELWMMEYNDPTFATAAAFSLNNALTEPLGIVSTEGGSFWSDDREGMTMVSSGFVRDRALPEGDAAVVVVADGSTVYAARVYSNGPAPTPLANDLVDGMIAAEVGDAEEQIDGTMATGGMWDVFPQIGDELLYGLEPAIVRHDEPSSIELTSTPVG